jgi:hypothetical protein
MGVGLSLAVADAPAASDYLLCGAFEKSEKTDGRQGATNGRILAPGGTGTPIVR